MGEGRVVPVRGEVFDDLRLIRDLKAPPEMLKVYLRAVRRALGVPELWALDEKAGAFVPDGD